MADREKIRAQAKQIMDEFVNALDRVGKIREEYGVERHDETRVPGKPSFPGFRQRFFMNAPKKNEEYIIAERKSW
ncbi:hypothetical protein HYV82_01165 [Candidatus Woesearchaeota archaeon]|nr:hypothetical protein [Candidatus Woesearchaeota archaeon]